MGLREEITEFVRLQVALGTDSYRGIVESTIYYLTGEAEPDEIAAIAAEVAAIELTAHCAAQETWPDLTDSDRLTAAFDELDSSGIIARECFTCWVADVSRTGPGLGLTDRTQRDRRTAPGYPVPVIVLTEEPELAARVTPVPGRRPACGATAR